MTLLIDTFSNHLIYSRRRVDEMDGQKCVQGVCSLTKLTANGPISGEHGHVDINIRIYGR